MQSAAFRSTVRQFTNSVAKHPSTKQRGVISLMFKDIGNAPLITANCVGGFAVCAFGARKLFYHPDIGIAEVNRFSNEVCNETEQRMESAHQFRAQTQFFGSFLHPISSFFMSTMTGQAGKGYGGEEDKWGLDFLRTVDAMQPPLESTNHFDDDLFTDVKVNKFTQNEVVEANQL